MSHTPAETATEIHGVRIRRRHLADYTQDVHNARAHNPTNIGLISDSLQRVGAGRSLVSDEDDVLLAGNGVSDAAAEVGLTDVIEVETTGREVVVVKRVGLTEEQKRALAIADNRANELSSWNVEVLRAVQAEFPAVIAQGWTAEQSATLLGVDFAAVAASEQGRLDVVPRACVTCPACGHTWEGS